MTASGSRFWRKLAMLVKVETTYATDAAPAEADAVVASNITFTPIEGDEVNRDLLLPYLGNQGTILTATYGKIEFDVEIAGAGAAGTVPKYDALLRSAGMAQTVTAGTSVVYSFVEDDPESATVYFVSDKVQHIFVGGVANIAPSFTPKQIPKFRVSYMGMMGTISDLVSMPDVVLDGVTTPLPVSKANTQMSLFGWASVAESLSLDWGNVLTPRFLIGDERVLISDRQAKGTAVVEARSVATINWFDKALTSAKGALSLIHGTTAGNIVEISAPAVQVGKPTQGQTDGIINYSLPLNLTPVNGLDELTLTIR